jgi:hypothetical protein
MVYYCHEIIKIDVVIVFNICIRKEISCSNIEIDKDVNEYSDGVVSNHTSQSRRYWVPFQATRPVILTVGFRGFPNPTGKY